jgi:predicted RNase H-like HicB family nuclease
MLYYAGIVQKDGKTYGIVFPDFPGCVSVGDTPEDAYKNGVEALSLHINGMKEDGDSVPRPRLLEEIKSSGEDWYDFDGAIIMYIPYISSTGRSVRINISVNQGLLDIVDSVTKNRSAFLSDMSEKYLVEKNFVKNGKKKLA